MVSSSKDIPLITTETLQYRLDTQNFGKTGGQRGSLTRCAQKYGSFQVALSSTTIDAKAIESTKDDLVREVELFELELTKLILLQQNLEKQVKRNRTAEAERDQAIKKAQEKVVESRSLAEQSLRRTNCLSEYESLAKVIHEHHPTSSDELQKRIEGLRDELSGLEGEIASRDETLKVREAQYQLLIQYMMDLKRTIEEDDDGEKENEETPSGASDDKPQPMEVDDLYGDL